MHVFVSKTELLEMRDKINKKLRGERGFSKNTKKKFLSTRKQLDVLIDRDEREVNISITKGKYKSMKELSLKKPNITSRSLFYSPARKSFALMSSSA